MPLGIICAAGLGFLLERVILRKVKFSSFVNLLIATVGVSYVLRNASMVIWGTNPQLFPSMFPSELIEIGEFRINPAVYRHYQHLAGYHHRPAFLLYQSQDRQVHAACPTLTLRALP